MPPTKSAHKPIPSLPIPSHPILSSIPHEATSELTSLRFSAHQGVGETLRGTFNSTIDKNFPRKNEKKAAAKNAQNEEILQRGRAEVEGIPGGWPGHHGPGFDGGYGEQDTPGFAGGAQARSGAGTGTGTGTNSPPREKGSLGKLFKRKPVGVQGMDSTTRA